MTKDSIYPLINCELPSKDSKRLFHGRGRRFPGWEQVNIEIYPPVLWVMIYQPIDEQPLLELLSQFKNDAAVNGIEAIYIQRRFERENPVEVWFGPDTYLEKVFQVTENGLHFLVELGRNQNSGLFLDMSEGRRWVRENSDNKHVLNLFSYTCSLGISALAGGASHVMNVDMAKSAIKRGQQNLAINQPEGKSIGFIAQDIFKVTKKLAQKKKFDLLIADPPSFQSKSFDVRKDYLKLLQKIKPALASDAELLLCLNSPALSPDFLIDLVKEVWANSELIGRVSNPAVLADLDEDSSLKVMHFKVTQE